MTSFHIIFFLFPRMKTYLKGRIFDEVEEFQVESVAHEKEIPESFPSMKQLLAAEFTLPRNYFEGNGDQ